MLCKNLFANVFDIHRFSVNDGPGIRTTIFLKGCPLSCVWCHNPESKSARSEVAFFTDRCILCRECGYACPQNAHTFIDGVHVYDRQRCVSEYECVNVCQYDALRLVGRKESLQSLIDLVLKDRAYYENSGGGVTISGGEPLLQTEFLESFLQEMRARGIHTCVDTSGYAKKDDFARILPYTNMFLFDYKATNEQLHKELTGVSLRPIMENLEFLYNSSAEIVLRCPLISGINDSDEHLRGIARLSNKYPRFKAVEIMPYHNTGNAKYERYGYKNPLPDLAPADEQAIKRWQEKLIEYNVVNFIINAE